MLANDFRNFMSDESRIGYLRKRFEEYIGPVRAPASFGDTAGLRASRTAAMA